MLLVGQQLSNALPTPFWSGAILPSSSRSAHSWRWPLGGARSQTRDFSLTISNNIYIYNYIYMQQLVFDNGLPFNAAHAKKYDQI